MNGLWDIESNDGDVAELTSESDRKKIHRPTLVSKKHFMRFLKPGGLIDDATLKILFPE